METAPNWVELSDLLDQLAYVAAAHAQIARSALEMSEHPGAAAQLRECLQTLSSGQDSLATALRQAASLSGTVAAQAQEGDATN